MERSLAIKAHTKRLLSTPRNGIDSEQEALEVLGDVVEEIKGDGV